jgi:hypothetical protein
MDEDEGRQLCIISGQYFEQNNSSIENILELS